MASPGHTVLVTIADVDRDALQRRTLRTLVGTQVLAGGATASAVTVGTLLAKDLTGRDWLAGMPTASLTLGAAIAAMPLARLASRRGRRPALGRALGIGSAGGLVVMLAALVGVFPLLLLGMVGAGVGQAAGLQTRYGAADLAHDADRGRAIALVVWATTIGSVAAPNLLGPSSSLFGGLGMEELAGLPLIGALLAAAGAVVVLRALRPDPLVVAGGVHATARPGRSIGTAVAVVRASVDGRLALGAMVTAHAVMVGVMSMTALHLDEGGQSKTFIGFVISVHVAGMYALSPVAGWIADGAGRIPALVAGAAVLVLATETSGHSAGSESGMMLTSLFLLGLGWSLTLVAGSALLTESVAPSARVSAQGLSDLAMSATGAAAGFAAGFLKEGIGYHHLSHVGMGAAIVVLVVAGRRWWSQRRSVPGISRSVPDPAPPGATGR